MYQLVQKRLDLHFFTKASTLAFCSGESMGVRPQLAYLGFGTPCLSADAPLTAFRRARCPGKLPLTVRTCFRTSLHDCFSFFRKNHALDA